MIKHNHASKLIKSICSKSKRSSINTKNSKISIESKLGEAENGINKLNKFPIILCVRARHHNTGQCNCINKLKYARVKL